MLNLFQNPDTFLVKVNSNTIKFQNLFKDIARF